MYKIKIWTTFSRKTEEREREEKGTFYIYTYNIVISLFFTSFLIIIIFMTLIFFSALFLLSCVYGFTYSFFPGPFISPKQMSAIEFCNEFQNPTAPFFWMKEFGCSCCCCCRYLVHLLPKCSCYFVFPLFCVCVCVHRIQRRIYGHENKMEPRKLTWQK